MSLVPSIESTSCKFIRLNDVLHSEDYQVWEVFVEIHPKKLRDYGFLNPEINDDCNYLEVEFCAKDNSVKILTENHYSIEMIKLIELEASSAISGSIEYYAKK